MSLDFTEKKDNKIKLAETIMKYIIKAIVIFLLIIIAGSVLFFFLFFFFGSCIFVRALKEEEAMYLLLQGRSKKEIQELDNYLSQSGLAPPTQAVKKYVSAQSRGGRENNIRGGE